LTTFPEAGTLLLAVVLVETGTLLFADGFVGTDLIGWNMFVGTDLVADAEIWLADVAVLRTNGTSCITNAAEWRTAAAGWLANAAGRLATTAGWVADVAIGATGTILLVDALDLLIDAFFLAACPVLLPTFSFPFSVPGYITLVLVFTCI